MKDGWLRSLAAFSSRLRWRSHFIQKFESECTMEFHAQNAAYEHLRCAKGDWNSEYYEAWKAGKTGFPMVDACMRCLLKHGWVNFRMRAMLASFAVYNLFSIGVESLPHLARCFLDYEPGIHYPQLQMQAGVTGINAMRVYSVTKQGLDHDPKGTFIRKYVPELISVPTKYIHVPWTMPDAVRKKVRARSACLPRSNSGRKGVCKSCQRKGLRDQKVPAGERECYKGVSEARVAKVWRCESKAQAERTQKIDVFKAHYHRPNDISERTMDMSAVHLFQRKGRCPSMRGVPRRKAPNV